MKNVRDGSAVSEAVRFPSLFFGSGNINDG